MPASKYVVSKVCKTGLTAVLLLQGDVTRLSREKQQKDAELPKTRIDKYFSAKSEILLDNRAGNHYNEKAASGCSADGSAHGSGP